MSNTISSTANNINIFKAAKQCHLRQKSANLAKKLSPSNLAKANTPMNNDLLLVEKPRQIDLIRRVKQG